MRHPGPDLLGLLGAEGEVQGPIDRAMNMQGILLPEYRYDNRDFADSIHNPIDKNDGVDGTIDRSVAPEEVPSDLDPHILAMYPNFSVLSRDAQADILATDGDTFVRPSSVEPRSAPYMERTPINLPYTQDTWNRRGRVTLDQLIVTNDCSTQYVVWCKTGPTFL